MLLLENWSPEMNLSTEHIRGTGAIGLLVWFIHPLAWLLASIGITGTVRAVAFAVVREPVGEPLVWLVLRTAGLLRRRTRRAVESRNLGPLRPDRLVWDAGCDLEIHSCRERPEWTEGMTLEVEERFFRLLGTRPGYQAPHHELVYRFAELDPNEVIRRRVSYRDLVEGES
jgi:hypothetical protein